MNFKITLILVGLLVTLAAAVYFLQVRKPPEGVEGGPEVWSVAEERIESIEIMLQAKGESVSFVKDADGSWRFNDAERSEVDLGRWGGIPLLLTGPTSKRLIAQKVENLAAYGLETPRMEIALGIQDWGRLRVLVGDQTPDAVNFYVKLGSYDPVYLVDRTWVEVLERLVTEPPRLSLKPSIRTATVSQAQHPAVEA